MSLLWTSLQPILAQITLPRIIWSAAINAYDMGKLTPFMLLLHALKPLSLSSGGAVSIDEKSPYDPVVYDIVEKSGIDSLDTLLTPPQQVYVTRMVQGIVDAQARQKAEYEAQTLRDSIAKQAEYDRTHHPCAYVMRAGARAGLFCGRIVKITTPVIPAAPDIRCSSHKN